MATRTWTVLMLAPLAAAVAIGYVGEAAAKPGDRQAAKEVKAKAKENAKAKERAEKPGKPFRVKAPPKPGVKTVIAPGTWRVHRHRGNSPLFEMGREKEWVDDTGPGKRPVIKRHDRPGNGKGKGHR